MITQDPWIERTRQLKLARAEMASKIAPPHEESRLGLGLIFLGFVLLYVLVMWLEAT